MLVFAHRGASGYAPENTLASFEKALEMGADGIELDVRLTKDGHVVVMHDPLVMRTTKRFGSIAGKTLKNLQQLDAGKGEKIPTLQEVLDLVHKKAQVHIELKGKGTPTPVANIITEYIQKKKWSYSDFVVSSFHHNELREFKKLLPQVQIGALIIGCNIEFDKYIKEFDAYSINMWSQLIKKSTVEEAHKRGFKIFAYTVNTISGASNMEKLRVDGIFTNYPDRVRLA